MAFFSNRTVNLLNLHYVITSAATVGGGAFYGIWLYQAGVPLPLVLLALAGVLGLRIVLRLGMLSLAVKWGLRPLVIVGAVLMALAYLFVPSVAGPGGMLVLLVFVTALGQTVYWPSYHAYYAALGDEAHRGQQLGAREAINALVGIVGPLLAGWLLVTYGPRIAFAVTAAIQALAATPLFFTPEVRIARNAPGALAASLPGAVMFAGDGLVTAGYVTVWQFALFFALGRNPMAYGGALAVAALAGALGSLVLGRLIDAGKGVRAVHVSIAAMVAVILLRAFGGDHRVLAVAANTMGALAACLYVPTLMTALYNQAQRSPCVMRFHIAAEAGWDVGGMAGLAGAAGLVALGVSADRAVLVALIGIVLGTALLRRYYVSHASERIDASLHQIEQPPL